MPRSIWNGTISFGLIAVPVKVYSATEDKTVHFHQVHVTDGARIEQKRICAKEDREVPYEEVVKGYGIRGGEYVILSQEELAAAAGDAAHAVELEGFVPAGDIDPTFYDRTYYLGAGDGGEDAYRLLHDALAKTERAGLGRWVFHNREYLAAVRAHDDTVLLHTMHFADELVDPGDVDVPSPSRKPTQQEVKMAGALVDSLHGKFKADAYRDTYREQVLELIARKGRGEEIEIEEPAAPEPSDDLMAALEASLKGSSSGKTAKGGKGSTGGRGSTGSKGGKGSKGRGRAKAGAR